MNKNPSSSHTKTWALFLTLLKHHVTATPLPSDFDLSFIHHELFLQWLEAHRMNLACYRLLKPFQTFLPPFLIETLKSRKQHLMTQHLSQTQLLIELTEALTAARLPFRVLKGLPLNQQLYDQQCIRWSQDIDILIDPVDLVHAHSVLTQLQWKKIDSVHALSTETFQTLPPPYSQWIIDLDYQHATKKLHLELHLKSFLHTRTADLVLDPALFISFKHMSLPVLTHEYNFVYLCHHAAKHSWARLQWLVDVAIFYRRYPLDWQKVLTLAKQRNQYRALLEARKLLLTLFDLHLPPIPLLNWKDQGTTQFRLLFVEQYWKTADMQYPFIWKKIRNRFYNGLLPLLLSPTWSGKHQSLLSLLHFDKPTFNEIRQYPHRNQMARCMKNLLLKLFFLNRAPRP